MIELQSGLLEGFQRHEQAARRASKGAETIALIEGLRALVLGIDEHSGRSCVVRQPFRQDRG